MGKKLSNQDVANIVDREGLDYAICHYIDSSDFIDRELATLWSQAKKILDQIEEKILTDDFLNDDE